MKGAVGPLAATKLTVASSQLRLNLDKLPGDNKIMTHRYATVSLSYRVAELPRRYATTALILLRCYATLRYYGVRYCGHDLLIGTLRGEPLIWHSYTHPPSSGG